MKNGFDGSLYVVLFMILIALFCSVNIGLVFTKSSPESKLAAQGYVPISTFPKFQC